MIERRDFLVGFGAISSTTLIAGCTDDESTQTEDNRELNETNQTAGNTQQNGTGQTSENNLEIKATAQSEPEQVIVDYHEAGFAGNKERSNSVTHPESELYFNEDDDIQTFKNVTVAQIEEQSVRDTIRRAQMNLPENERGPNPETVDDFEVREAKTVIKQRIEQIGASEYALVYQSYTTETEEEVREIQVTSLVVKDDGEWVLYDWQTPSE